MIATAFTLVGLLLIGVGVKYLLSGCRRTGFGWIAISTSMVCVTAAVTGDRAGASTNAAVAAVFIWWWWNSGGGDGTRRRLRKWARAFQGVRRTAPVGSAA